MAYNEELNTRHELAEYKLFSAYLRKVEGQNRKETWDEAVDRVFNQTYITKYKDIVVKNAELRELIEFAREAYKDRLVLASQRILQFGGPQVLKHEMKVYNCLSSYCDRPRYFQECMYLLLCGCGTGTSVQYKHHDKLPLLIKRGKATKTYQIPDSIEGWADSVGVLISSFLSKEHGTFPEYSGKIVHMDYSLIREEGALISGGFKAPGPNGLKKSLEKIEDLLNRVVNQQSGKLETIDSYDIVMHIADAVLSGGVRRSATIFLFSPTDTKMAQAKTGNWFIDQAQRGRSNNSCALMRSKVTLSEFEALVNNAKIFGEPGFIFVDDEDTVFNPCVTPETNVLTEIGYQQISTLEDQITKIWNGEQWSEVTIKKTGENQKILKVILDDGTLLECTPYHKWYIYDGIHKGKPQYKKIETSGLEIGDKLIKYDLPIIEGDQQLSKAYTNGFYSGDGCFFENNAIIYLYSEKKLLEPFIESGNSFRSENNERITFGNVKGLQAKFFVPDARYTIESRLQWFAGLLDSDGCVARDKRDGNEGLQISSIHLDFLKEVQLMLQTLGIRSKVKTAREAGKSSLPKNDGTGEYKDYDTKKCYRILISSVNLHKLSQLGLITHRLVYEAKKPERDAGQFTKVLEIIDENRYDDTYCFNEPLRHMGMFNGILTGNCVEISMHPQTITGESGWQGCNLVEIAGVRCNTPETFYQACKAGAIMGTLQAGFTNFKYVTEATKKIFEHEALLGVSVTGWLTQPDVLLNEEVQREGARIVKYWNKIVAEMIGINQSARTTCSKPAGNTAILLETTSGVSPEHSHMYIRHVQANRQELGAQVFKDLNPNAVEQSVWSSSGTDYCLAFPIVTKGTELYKSDIFNVKHLEIIKSIQQNWIEEGTNIDLCTKPYLRHNVSNTVDIDDWDVFTKYVYENRQWFAGISTMARGGDRNYNQAPNTAVYTPQEMVEMYGSAAIFASGLIVDALEVFDTLWTACDTVLDRGEKLVYTDEEVEKVMGTMDIGTMWLQLKADEEYAKNMKGLGVKPPRKAYREFLSNDLRSTVFKFSAKVDWIRRAKQFAANNFNGDLEKMTYCLKDVQNYHKWIKICRNWQTVDWSKVELNEDLRNADSMGALACSGQDGCVI